MNKKQRLKDIIVDLNDSLPIIMTIQYSDNGRYLKALSSVNDLKSYMQNKEVSSAEITEVKTVRNTTYIEAMTMNYSDEKENRKYMKTNK
jgi:hypothetical protein